MPRKREPTFFAESARMNNWTWESYFYRILELAVSTFKWENVPESMNIRYLEICLFYEGHSLVFKDDVMGLINTKSTISGRLDIYNNPIKRRAYAANGYQKQLDIDNSVIVWNNFTHTPSVSDVMLYAKRLYNLDRIIDVNANAQKTPVLIDCEENQRLTMVNLYKEYDGNSPVIFGNKGLDIKALQVLKTDAPYISDKLYQLKLQYYDEILQLLGVPNTGIHKKERLVTEEVETAQGSTEANRQVRLQPRLQACEEINRMFGTNISVDFANDIEEMADKEEQLQLEKKYQTAPEGGSNNG